jgi:hypothetical protein
MINQHRGDEQIRAENAAVYKWLDIREVSFSYLEPPRNVVRVIRRIYKKFIRGRGTGRHEASARGSKRTARNLTKIEHPSKVQGTGIQVSLSSLTGGRVMRDVTRSWMLMSIIHGAIRRFMKTVSIEYSNSDIDWSSNHVR